MSAKKRPVVKSRKSPTKYRRWTPWVGTHLVVTYKGGLNHEKDRAIRKALGEHETGSGYSFMGEDGGDERDFSAVVPDCPPQLFVRVVEALKKIRGITIKKRITKWVRL